MNILVTGTEGYLGSLLAPLLIDEGHSVTGVDVGFYKSGYLYRNRGTQARTLVKDIRDISEEDIAGHDVVVHMAELSNDPTGELSPTITYEINHRGTVRLAELAKKVRVGRFIYMSSCSVYGVAGSKVPVTEESPINPQTAYAECKALCERDLNSMASADFSPVYMRNATAFGASPRQRFDLVVNNLCGLAFTTGKIAMTSDGSPWRPLVHGLDIAQAIVRAIEAPRKAVHNQIFNVGSNEQNYTIKEVAEIVGNIFTDCEITFGDEGADNRSYRVNFDKIHKHLPDFNCQWDVEKGVQQFYDLFRQIDMTDSDFQYRAFTRLKQLEYLIRTKQIDEHFFWTTEF